MTQPLTLHLEDLRRPHDEAVFKDSDGDWLAFRKKRFAVAGDGKHAMVYGLDLSGYNLQEFPAGWLVFVRCNLDKVSFRRTEFLYETTFIECSMRNIDLTSSQGASALLYGCDLTGARFPASTVWATRDLDGATSHSIFYGCTLDKPTEVALIDEGNIIWEMNRGENELTLLYSINDILRRAVVAPRMRV